LHVRKNQPGFRWISPTGQVDRRRRKPERLGDDGSLEFYRPGLGKDKLGATFHAAKRDQPHRFVALPERWVPSTALRASVERSFDWLETCHRLWKNCERKLDTRLQFVHLPFLVLLINTSRTGSEKPTTSDRTGRTAAFKTNRHMSISFYSFSS